MVRCRSEIILHQTWVDIKRVFLYYSNIHFIQAARLEGVFHRSPSRFPSLCLWNRLLIVCFAAVFVLSYRSLGRALLSLCCNFALVAIESRRGVAHAVFSDDQHFSTRWARIKRWLMHRRYGPADLSCLAGWRVKGSRDVTLIRSLIILPLWLRSLWFPKLRKLSNWQVVATTNNHKSKWSLTDGGTHACINILIVCCTIQSHFSLPRCYSWIISVLPIGQVNMHQLKIGTEFSVFFTVKSLCVVHALLTCVVCFFRKLTSLTILLLSHSFSIIIYHKSHSGD